MDRVLYATNGGYLLMSSGVTWVDCLAQTAETNRESADFIALKIGNQYYVPPLGGELEQRWDIARSLLHFTLPDFRVQEGVTSATLRLYVNRYDFSNGGEFQAYLLETPFGTIGVSDWTAHVGQEYATTLYTGLATDEDGNDYFEFDLTAAQLAMLTPGGSADFVIREKNDITSGDPYDAGDKWIRAHAHGAPQPAVLPTLTLTILSGRERIERALITTLEGISEADGYSTSPVTVTRGIADFSAIPETSLPALCVLADDETREPLPGEIADCDWVLKVLATAWYKDGETPGEVINRLVDDVDRALAASPTLGLPSTVCERAWLQRADGNPGLITKDHRAYALLHIHAKHTRFLNA